MVFLPIWLTGWAFGEVFAARELLEKGPQLFLGVWLIFWTFGGLTALYKWLAQIIGTERVTLATNALTIQRDVFGFEPTREYELSSIRNLRVSRVDFEAKYMSRNRPGIFDNGPIAFDYGAKTYRFGAGVDESEASAIIEELKSRHAFSG